MSNPDNHGSWDYTNNDAYGQSQQHPAPGEQPDPWAHPDQAAQPVTDPYGQAPESDPFAQQPASDPYGQSSASDPFEQPAASPYGQSAPSPYGSPQFGGGAGAPYAQPNSGELGQSRLLVGLLGIFLGGFGVHRFLLGYTAIGIIQIVVTVVTCGFGAVWGLIEGIMVLAKAPYFERDAHGRPLAE